jgi:hypothetical protein
LDSSRFDISIVNRQAGTGVGATLDGLPIACIGRKVRLRLDGSVHNLAMEVGPA